MENNTTPTLISIFGEHIKQPPRKTLYHFLFDSEKEDVLSQTQYMQPVSFCIIYRLFKLWASWGIRPKAPLAHSIGELIATYTAVVSVLKDFEQVAAHINYKYTRYPIVSNVTIDEVDWKNYYKGRVQKHLTLPNHPFKDQYYWKQNENRTSKLENDLYDFNWINYSANPQEKYAATERRTVH